MAKDPRRFGSVERLLQKGITNLHLGLYRVSNGRIGGRLIGMPVLILNTKGRKTGQRRTTILTYMKNEEDLVLVASNGGTRNHPTWYLNLSSNPEVEVELGRKSERRIARTASPDEKERLWPGIVKTYRGYGGYQKRTDRDIPVVILERPGSTVGAEVGGHE